MQYNIISNHLGIDGSRGIGKLGRSIGLDLRVGRSSLVLNISNISIISSSSVGHSLDPAIRKVDGVGSLHIAIGILVLSSIEGSASVVISNSILVCEGLRGLIIGSSRSNSTESRTGNSNSRRSNERSSNGGAGNERTSNGRGNSKGRSSEDRSGNSKGRAGKNSWLSEERSNTKAIAPDSIVSLGDSSNGSSKCLGLAQNSGLSISLNINIL